MRLSQFVPNLAVILGLILVAACGKDLDTKQIQGTWRLQSFSGSGPANTAIRFEGGHFSPMLTTGRFDCSAPYRVDGMTIITNANTSGTCAVAANRFEVESVTSDTLILRRGDTRMIYKRDAESRGR